MTIADRWAAACRQYELDGDAFGLVTCQQLMSVPGPPDMSDCVAECYNSTTNTVETCEALCGVGPVTTGPGGPVWTVTGTATKIRFPWLLLLLLIAMIAWSHRK